MYNPTYKYEVTAGGGTFTVPVTDPLVNIELYTSGAVVLAGGFTVTSSGTAKAGVTFQVLFNTASLTATGQTVTIFGEQIDSTLIDAATYLWVKCVYSSVAGKFIVTVFPNFDESTGFIVAGHLASNSVTTAKIKDNEVTLAKLVDFGGRGYTLRGGAAGAPEEFDAKTSGNLLAGDGTDLESMPVTGDVTIAHSGGNLVTTIGAGVVEESMLAFTFDSMLYTSLTVSSVQILALNATPLTIIAAPGSGKWIEVISATVDMNYDTAAYATNTTLQLICDGANIAQLQDTAALISTVDKVTKFKDVTSATAGQTQIIKNTAVQLKVATGDPTGGSGTMVVHVAYRIVSA